MTNEELAASATITAAKIQADITLEAAYYNCAAIIFGLFITWMTALHIQKVGRLAEIKRTVYLDLISSYSEMHAEFYNLFNNEKENSEDSLNEKIIKFSTNADKTSFICKTKTKKAIYEFLDFFKAEFLLVAPFVRDYIDARDLASDLILKHSKIMGEFDRYKLLIDEYRLQDPTDKRIGFLLDEAKAILNSAQSLHKQLTESLEDKDEKKQLAKEKVTVFLNSLNKFTVPISHKLKKELGANTDVKLDYSLHGYRDK
ncbi:hypothetical protein [Acinetobacter geminorum]|uniref:hypothetical protein n=1 Tax=Acinetobacter geminorum TaxID=2730922 RepID=UPI003AF92879